MQTIKIQLVNALIIEAVKSETFIRGQVVKATDPKLLAEAYHEQAGDEQYQERILIRGLYTNLAELKTHLSDYVSTLGATSSDNITSTEDNGVITLSIVVTERFNKGFSDPLAKLCAKFIEDSMLVDWWKPINEKQATLYLSFVEKDLLAIKRCFNKTAPTAPTVPYTSVLNTTGSAIEIGVGEETTVTYELSDGAIDDIECRTKDRFIVDVARTEQGFTVIGKHLGHTYITLYSRHDNSLERVIHVFVTDQS